MATELVQLMRRYERKGWTITRTGGGHLRWVPPGGGSPVITPSTPSDPRSLRNAERYLRRASTSKET